MPLHFVQLLSLWSSPRSGLSQSPQVHLLLSCLNFDFQPHLAFCSFQNTFSCASATSPTWNSSPSSLPTNYFFRNQVKCYLCSSDGKESAHNAGDLFRSLGQEYPLEKGMATLCNILAWRIPWTEKPGDQSPGGSKESDTTEQLTIHYLTYHGMKKMALSSEFLK